VPWDRSQRRFIRLWVEDNGIGIAPEYRDRIFRIFERLHGVETYPGPASVWRLCKKEWSAWGAGPAWNQWKAWQQILDRTEERLAK